MGKKEQNLFSHLLLLVNKQQYLHHSQHLVGVKRKKKPDRSAESRQVETTVCRHLYFNTAELTI